MNTSEHAALAEVYSSLRKDDAKSEARREPNVKLDSYVSPQSSCSARVIALHEAVSVLANV